MHAHAVPRFSFNNEFIQIQTFVICMYLPLLLETYVFFLKLFRFFNYLKKCPIMIKTSFFK